MERGRRSVLVLCTVLGRLCKRRKSLSQLWKSCCRIAWHDSKIPTPKESFFFSDCSRERFEACDLQLTWLCLTANFSWPVSGVYLSKPCWHVGDFCFGMVHTPIPLSVMDWAFAECFSHGKKKSKLLGSYPPALKRFPELVHWGCKAWGADLSAEVHLSQPAEVTLGMSKGRIWTVQIASNYSRLLSHMWNLRSGI